MTWVLYPAIKVYNGGRDESYRGMTLFSCTYPVPESFNNKELAELVALAIDHHYFKGNRWTTVVEYKQPAIEYPSQEKMAIDLAKTGHLVNIVPTSNGFIKLIVDCGENSYVFTTIQRCLEQAWKELVWSSK